MKYYNPIPLDATDIYSDHAYYKRVINKGEWRLNEGNYDNRTRWYQFNLGRSDKEEMWKDQFIDDKALAILQRTLPKGHGRGTRLIIKGYSNPVKTKGAYTHFHVLTHIGIHRRDRSKAQVGNSINPITGELGMYKLATK